MIHNPEILIYSIYTPISLLTRKFGEEYLRGVNIEFTDEFGAVRELKGIYYYFPINNTLVSILNKISSENPIPKESLDGDKPIPSNLIDEIDWDFNFTIPRCKFPEIHNIFSQVEYYTNFYFSATVSRNDSLKSLELSELVTFTLPCPTSKLIFESYKDVGENLDFRGIVKLLGFDYSKTVKDIEDDLTLEELAKEII